MAKRNVVYHSVNPYQSDITSHQAVIYNPDEYRLNLMLTQLIPVALRVLLYAMANVQPDGRVALEPMPIGRKMRTPSTHVSLGIRQLVKFNLIQRQTRTVFWLSPLVARPIAIKIH